MPLVIDALYELALEVLLVKQLWRLSDYGYDQAGGLGVQFRDQGSADHQVIMHQLTGALITGAVWHSPAHHLAGAVQDVVLTVLHLGPKGCLQAAGVRETYPRPLPAGRGEVLFVAAGFDEGDEVPGECQSHHQQRKEAFA